MLHSCFTHLKKVHWKENTVLSMTYFMSSVGADDNTIQNYLKHQGDQELAQHGMEL